MSESFGENPYTYGTPEWEQYTRGAVRGAAIGATAIPPGLASLVIPAGTGGVSGALPGAVTGAYSGIDTVSGLLQHYAGGVKVEDIHHLPGAVEAGRLAGVSLENANDYIPHVEPENQNEAIAMSIGNTVGQMLPSVPAGVAAGLPRAANIAAHVMLPGPKAIPISVGVQTGLSMVNDAQAADSQDQVLDYTQPHTGAASDTGDQILDYTHPQAQAQAQPQTAPDQVLDYTQQTDPVIDYSQSLQAPQNPSGLTHGDIALGAIGTGLVIAGGYYLRGRIGDIRDVKFAEASKVSNAAQAANAGVMPPDKVAAMPGASDSRLTRFMGSVVDQNAVIHEYNKAIAPTPLVADQMRAEVGDITGSMPQVQRFQAAQTSGRMFNTNMPAAVPFYKSIAALTDQQRDLLNTALHYGNEMDNRQNVAFLKNGAPDEPANKVNFQEKSYEQLNAGVQAAEADPQVKAIIDQHKLRTDAMADMLVDQGMLTQSEGQRLKDTHTYYVPDSDFTNIINNPLGRRNITEFSGSSTLPKVWDLIDQHDFALYKAVEQNKFVAGQIARGMDYQSRPDVKRGNVMPAQVFQDSRNPITKEWVPKDDGTSIPYRVNGELRHTIVNNPTMLHVLKGSPVQINTLMSTVNKARQIQQSFITGPLSTVFGSAFPVLNALRSSGEMTVVRPAGMYASHLDKWAQRVSGGRLAFRGDPISGYLGTTERMIADPLAEMSRGMSEMLAPEANNSINTSLRALFGDGGTDAIHARLQAVYANSNRAAMRERGLLNSAGFTAKDVGSDSEVMSKGGQAFMPTSDMVPELFHMNQALGMKPTYVYMKNLFNEMRSAIGDAAHSNVYRLNENNPNLTPHQLNYELRQLTGDPGTHGSGGFARSYAQAVPFGNVAIQELSRVARAGVRNPVAAPMAWMTHYGTIVAASVFSAILAGPDAIKHQIDENSTTQRENSISFYVPGHPTQPIRLPVQIDMRPGVPVMIQALHDMYSTLAHAHDPDMATHAMHVFTDFFSKHIWHSTQDSVVAALSGAVPPVMPTIANPVIAGLSGDIVDPTIYSAYKNYNKPFSSWFKYDVSGANEKLPGQTAGAVDPLTGTTNGSVMKHILSDALGIGGIAMNEAWHRAGVEKTHDLPASEMMSYLGQEWTQRARDSLPGGNLLWNTEERRTTQTPLAEHVESYLEKMRPMASWKSDATLGGYTRSGGPALPEPPSSVNAPKDPMMLNLYATAGAYMNALRVGKGAPLEELSDLRKMSRSLDNSPMSPVAKREAQNGYVQQEQAVYEKVMAIIHMMNGDLSRQVGKDVDFRDINFNRGPEQFAQ